MSQDWSPPRRLDSPFPAFSNPSVGHKSERVARTDRGKNIAPVNLNPANPSPPSFVSSWTYSPVTPLPVVLQDLIQAEHEKILNELSEIRHEIKELGVQLRNVEKLCKSPMVQYQLGDCPSQAS